jgi:hypothetical protein
MDIKILTKEMSFFEKFKLKIVSEMFVDERFCHSFGNIVIFVFNEP